MDLCPECVSRNVDSVVKQSLRLQMREPAPLYHHLQICPCTLETLELLEVNAVKMEEHCRLPFAALKCCTYLCSQLNRAVRFDCGISVSNSVAEIACHQ